VIDYVCPLGGRGCESPSNRAVDVDRNDVTPDPKVGGVAVYVQAAFFGRLLKTVAVVSVRLSQLPVHPEGLFVPFR